MATNHVDVATNMPNLVLKLSLPKGVNMSIGNKGHEETDSVIMINPEDDSALVDMVLINMTNAELKVPNSEGPNDSFCHVIIIDENGNTNRLDEKREELGGMSGVDDAKIIEPMGCMVHRVWFQMKPTVTRQEVHARVQMIFDVPILAKTVTLRTSKSQVVVQREIEVTRDLGLWHGRIASEWKEVEVRWAQKGGSKGVNP